MASRKLPIGRPHWAMTAVLAAAFHIGFAVAGPAVRFDIPAQPLSSALRAAASQAGVQIVFAADTVGALKAGAVKGEISIETVLAQLLAGSGLEFRREGEGNYVVVRIALEQGTLPEMVVTATRTERRADEVPASVSVITSSDLQRQHLLKPQDALRHVEGVDFNTSTSTGGADLPRIRGIGGSSAGTTTSVLVDGMATDSSLSSVVGRGGFNFLAPQDIERIEVVRGPVSALYGPNVVGGVVNVIPKRWRGEPGAEVGVELGTHNTQAVSAAVGMANEALDIRLSTYDFRTDGFVASSTDKHSRNWRDLKWNLNGAARPTTDQEVSFGIQQFRTNQDYYGGTFEATGKHEGSAYTVGYRREFGHGEMVKIGYRHADLLQTWFDAPTGMGVGRRRSITDTMDAQVDIRPVEGNILSFGTNLQYADYKSISEGNTTTVTASGQKTTALFIQDEHRFGALAVTAGARQDRIDLAADAVNGAPKNGNGSIKTVVNPRAGVRYHLAETTSLYASYGTAYLPALNSFKFVQPSATRVDNPDLKPESSVSKEIGMNHRWSTGNLRAAVFHTDYKDQIALGTDPVSGKGQWQNIAVVKADGVELAYQGKFGRSWEPYANWSYTRARDFTKPGAAGTESKRLSPHKFNTGITYTPDDVWSATINVRYASGRYFNSLTQAQWAGPYAQTDLKVSAKLLFQGQKMEAFFAANNLTGKKFEAYNKDEWSDGATYTVGLSGRF